MAPGEIGDDALVSYYDRTSNEPFGSGFTDDFMTCEAGVIREFDDMPLAAGRRSDLLQAEVEQLINRYRG